MPPSTLLSEPGPDGFADADPFGTAVDPAEDAPSPSVEEVLDDYLGAGGDDSHDAEIEDLLERATTSPGGHLERVSALSALSSQMGRYKVLTTAEQAAAFARYTHGLEAAAALSVPGRLSARRRTQLQRTVTDGEDAQSELVGSMFRLVLLIAREQATQRHGSEKSLDLLPDLVAEANLAVVESVASFDPARGPAFSVYAGRVVRERVRHSLSRQSPVGVPASWVRVKRLATTLAPDLAAQLGRKPTIAEMQEGLRAQCMVWALNHLSEAQQRLPEQNRLAVMEQKLVKQGMIGAIERYEEVMLATATIGSLDAPLGEDGHSTLGASLPQAASSETFDAIELDELRTHLMRALSQLPERDREIVMHRFGFVDGEMWTYAKLAPNYGISAERVRQIERNALSKLAGPGLDSLSGFLPSQL